MIVRSSALGALGDGTLRDARPLSLRYRAMETDVASTLPL